MPSTRNVIDLGNGRRIEIHRWNAQREIVIRQERDGVYVHSVINGKPTKSVKLEGTMMSDPFQDAHRSKAIADARAAEKETAERRITDATARGQALMAKKPAPKPYVPAGPFWKI